MTTPSEAAKMLAQIARQRTERTCQTCGKSFLGAGRALYCSDYCKVKAYRKRRKT